ncbi:hypothetical protein C9F11_37430 [Streptomyces sp. YIM 121038]|uniref:hypothetical protein n=1 Tax=Streptomyces sp. YIM 121038 TaxID=2136401 RepID=UPI001164FF4A|nr:hypothetical protein [Streptomyces sp. YIM 121038]QCX81069.1 hypothetical protein C9F11_37430 [Streptomyces sp. YIM 121038]
MANTPVLEALFPAAALVGLLGLCSLAPRRARLLYLTPISATTLAILALAALGIAVLR